MIDAPIDELYDTQRDVVQDPCGAWMAIQSQAAEIAALKNALRKIADTTHLDTCSTELSFAFHVCDCHVETARAALSADDDQ